jgi:dihydrofolate synthase/folylpolyglutamate synthase
MPNRSLEEWLAVIETRHPNEIDLGLVRVGQVWSLLTAEVSPLSNPAFITVAGTNGKGSCVAAMQALLISHGHSVGAFTSPHFLHYNERIVINGVPASDAQIVTAFELIEDVKGDISLTYFEFNALAALVIFRQQNVDAVLLEVGKAKLGVARRNKPLLVGEPDLPHGFADKVADIGADALFIGKDFRILEDKNKSSFTSHVKDDSLTQSIGPMDHCSLLPENITLALQALVSAGFSLNSDICCRTVSSLSLIGRLQKVKFKGINVILDVAHNPAAAKILMENLPVVSGKTFAVASVLADKDWAGIVEQMGTSVDEWLIGQINDNQRALDARSLLKVVYTAEHKGRCYQSVENAFQQAIIEASSLDQVIVFGSFHTVSAVLTVMSKEG